jgi:hypothetical protein
LLKIWKREGTHVLDGERERLVDDQLDLGNIESTSSDIYTSIAHQLDPTN